MTLKIKLQIAGQEVELSVEQLQELKAELDTLLPPRYYSHTLSAPPLPPMQFHTPTHPNNPITCAAQHSPN